MTDWETLSEILCGSTLEKLLAFYVCTNFSPWIKTPWSWIQYCVLCSDGWREQLQKSANIFGTWKEKEEKSSMLFQAFISLIPLTPRHLCCLRKRNFNIKLTRLLKIWLCLQARNYILGRNYKFFLIKSARKRTYKSPNPLFLGNISQYLTIICLPEVQTASR